jgi:hypothetical protein
VEYLVEEKDNNPGAIFDLKDSEVALRLGFRF